VITYQLSIATKGGLLTDPAIAQRFDREIAATLAELGALGQNRVVNRTPAGVASGGGGLRGSIFTEAYGIPAGRGQTIASSVYYAPIVERGRAAGQKRPPFGPILLWVTRKLGKSGAEAQHVTFLIARKIGRAGTVGARMFERTAIELRPIVQARFQALANRIGEILK
jgi:hypothetical protein